MCVLYDIFIEVLSRVPLWDVNFRSVITGPGL